MTSPGNGNSRDFIILQQVVSRLADDVQDVRRQQGLIIDKVNGYGVLSYQVGELAAAVKDLRDAHRQTTKDNEIRQQWFDSYRNSVEGLNQQRSSRVTSSYMTAIGWVIALTIALLGAIIAILSRK